MLPRQGEIGENTPFTRKCTSETLERVTTQSNLGFAMLLVELSIKMSQQREDRWMTTRTWIYETQDHRRQELHHEEYPYPREEVSRV